MHNGEEGPIIGRDKDHNPINANRMLSVLLVMYAQVLREYPSLPPVESLTLGEVRFFYDKLRPELLRGTKPSET